MAYCYLDFCRLMHHYIIDNGQGYLQYAAINRGFGPSDCDWRMPNAPGNWECED
jgi:hypothetical protein